MDGTANSAFTERRRQDGSKIVKPTNVLKLARAIQPVAPGNGVEQILSYDVGVGSLGIYRGMANRVLALSDKILGGLGAGFEHNVEEALHFLALNHTPNDEVFVFGFSRGAATAQAVTVFFDWAGGLPQKSDAYYLPFLFRRFVESRGTASFEEVLAAINLERSKSNRQPLARFQAITVQFLGVWDTVMALGSRFKATRGHTSSPSNTFYATPKPARCVLHARQALAIDEARYDFRPEIWQASHGHQTLQQRWFPGVHSNVGGSYVNDGLANIALHWMLGEAQQHGLEVDAAFVKHYRPYVYDRMYRSDQWYYRIFDAWRRRLGRGRRTLDGHPGTANLTLDSSAIRRMHWPHTAKAERHVEMNRPYRPNNVIDFLAAQPNLDAYLQSLGLDENQRTLPPDLDALILRRRQASRPT